MNTSTKHNLRARYLGRRLSETINTSFQQTLFEYTSSFPAFLTRKTLTRLSGDGAPGDASPDLVSRYVSDTKGRVEQEIHETGTGDLVPSYTYDNNNNKLTTTDPNGSGAADASYEYDNLNRVFADASSVSEQQYKYDLAGNRTYVQYCHTGRVLVSIVEFGSTADRRKANTKEEDPTGLLNEGFRYRDLETGEFITRDPAGFIIGPNLYTYVRQNPCVTMHRDT